MKKLQQSDVDKLDHVIHDINTTIDQIDSVICEDDVNKAKLAFFLGKLSTELYDQRNKIQEVVDIINDNDLVEDDVDNLMNVVEDSGWEFNAPEMQSHNTTEHELPF